MVEVESANVLAMRDAQFEELIDEINAKQAQTPYVRIFALVIVVISIGAAYIFGPTAAIGITLALPAWVFGKWLDSYKRRSVLFYNLEKDAAAAYETVTNAFDSLIACGAKWHIEAGGVVTDLTTWKRNAGAAYVVRKNSTKLEYAVPTAIASNITPPSIRVGKQIIYFFPDAAFVFDGKCAGAVSYDRLAIKWQESPFIEEGAVPADAQVISHTWKHPNKNGGPDRRFANNYQIPVCLYEIAHLTSDSGLNELVEFSRTGLVAPFAGALRGLISKSSGSHITALARAT